MNPSEKSLQIGAAQLHFETGAIARQADGAVLVRHGESVVLVSAVSAPAEREGMGFFPLTVEYREKMAAGGRIPGGYLKREGRASDGEILACRLIDRSIRPLFPKQYRCETQVLATVLSADPASDLPVLALLGACAALQLSDIPWSGPLGGLRVARIGGRFVALPNPVERREAEIDLVVSCSSQGLVMVEGEAAEATEEDVVDALLFAQQALTPFLELCVRWREERGCAQRSFAPPPALADQRAAEVEASAAPLLAEAIEIADKLERRRRIQEAGERVLASLGPLEPDERRRVEEHFGELLHRAVRRKIAQHGARLDGRKPEEIRPISGRVSWLPRAHGSAIFTRGETQALVSCTLGTGEEAQRFETVHGPKTRRFLLHYNFPPYSVGETRPLRGPGRREIGHGNLARRALAPVLPSFEDFPYVIRLESEIAESNGSSSMATVCGGCMALMDCGVPLRAPVAGIAMGLVVEGGEAVILSDILGDEDHLGDMDFKVTGTAEGITALQMDNKLGSLEREILVAALEQAGRGRRHILGEMAAILPASRPQLPPQAPRVSSVRIRPERIGALIGPRGETIKDIQSESGARVSVDEEGLVCVYAIDGTAARHALRRVREAAGDVELERVYLGTVTGVKDFGCFVRIYNGVEGLVHVSELGDGPCEHPSKVVSEGDEIVVRVMGADERGRLQLSHREALGTPLSDVAN